MIYTDGTPTIASMGVSAPCSKCGTWPDYMTKRCQCEGKQYGNSAPIDDPYYNSLSGLDKVVYLDAYHAAKRLLMEEDNEPREYGIRDSEA